MQHVSDVCLSPTWWPDDNEGLASLAIGGHCLRREPLHGIRLTERPRPAQLPMIRGEGAALAAFSFANSFRVRPSV